MPPSLQPEPLLKSTRQGREPFVEGGRGDARALGGKQHVPGHLRPEQRRPGRHQPHRAALALVGAAAHVHHVLRLRPGEVGMPAQRRADGKLGEHGRHVVGRDRLYQQRRDLGHPVPLGPGGHHGGEVVELGGREDGPRHRAFAHQAFLLPLAGVVRVADDPMNAGDGEQHVMPDPGPLLGGEQVAGGRAEPGHRLVGPEHRPVAGVDHRLDPGQGGVQPHAGLQVGAELPAHPDHFVPVPLQGRDGARPDVAGRPGDCDTHKRTLRRRGGYGTAKVNVYGLRIGTPPGPVLLTWSTVAV
jgi:hypothetical protein